MSWIISAYLIGAVALLPSGVSAGESDPLAPKPPLYLKSLKIIGASAIPRRQVRQQLIMPLPSIWPWRKPPPFSEAELEQNISRLKAFYRSQGFYHTEIAAQIRQDSRRRVEAELHINEGPPVTTASIEVEVTDPAAAVDFSSLFSQYPINVGDRFTERTYDNLKSLHLDYLLNHGYPHADVQGRVYLDDKLNTAAIVLTIDPGPLSYFGQTRIEGHRDTPDYLIRRQLAYKENELFDFRKVYQSQRNLYKLDLFSSVAISPEEIPATEAEIPLEVKVVEAKKRSVTGGLGWGTEDQIRARLGLRLRNLGGGGRILDFEGRYSRIDSSFASSFTNPQLWGSYNDLVVSSGLFFRDYPAFDDRILSGETRLERQLPWGIKAYGGYMIQFDRQSDIPGTTQDLFRESQDRTFRSSLAFLGLRLDTSDDVVYPTRGGMLLAHGEAAPSWLGSQVHFTAARVEGRRYLDLWQKKFILATRAVVGLLEPIQGTQEIPLFRRFYTGGFNSVRGYRLYALGPVDAAGNPVGGNSLLEGSAELRFPVYKDLRGVGFVDAGNAFPTISSMDAGQLKYGAGFGLRYLTPMGPVGLDLAFPLNRIQQKQSSFQVYITIGQTF